MKVSKLRVFFALVAAGMAALVLIQPQSAIGATSVGGLRDGGVLRLRLGATDHLKWQPTAGSDTGAVTQSINAGSGCGISLGAGALASFSSTGGSVGLVSDGLGVRGSGEGTGQPCGRIDGAQTLSLQLGSGLTGRAADFAELDLEGKFNAIVRVTGTLGSTTKTETYDTMGSDSGPDSGDADNYRVRFPKSGKFLFTKLTVAVTSGGASLEGGADGTAACSTAAGKACEFTGSLGATIDGGNPTTDTLLHLVKIDGTLGCDATAPTETSNGISISLTRLANIDDATGGDCVAIPYDLETALGQVDILKDLLGEDAQFRVVITWPATSEDYPVQASTIDYGSGPVPLEWCLADGTNDANTGFPDLPTGHAYCLEDQHADQNLSTGLVTVTETLYGQLDPTIKRG